MRINSGIKQGLLLLLEVSGKKDPVRLCDIAKKEDLSPKTLETIAAALSKAGILHAKKGKQGGYLLARRPEQISLAEVFLAIEPSYFSFAQEDERLFPFLYRYGTFERSYLNQIRLADITPSFAEDDYVI